MRSLLIIRHAKSSWDDPGLDDFDRPLNKRGKRDAPEMGKRLRKADYSPDLMISSPAKRALDTCRVIAEKLDYPSENIRTDERLYHASTAEFLQVLSEINDKYHKVVIFGHNPGLTDFANRLNHSSIINIPTSGMVLAELDIRSWKEIGPGKGKMKFFDYPKNNPA